MVLESTIVCVDNSEWMRNGDFLPTRIAAQQDAVSVICNAKTRSNPENNVALMTSGSLEVLCNLTTDVGRILSKLHNIQPAGKSNFSTGIKIAHLALKHRQGKNHKMRIVVFIGSPMEDPAKDLVKVAKKLKKEKVNVDIISLGEDTDTTEKLSQFIETLNGKEGSGSHLVVVPPGPNLTDAVRTSPVVQGEDGAGAGFAAGGDFGSGFDVDPNLDPELALALRVSMEEQRQRQEAENKDGKSGEAMQTDAPADAPAAGGAPASNEDALLMSAINSSLGNVGGGTGGGPDYSNMTEDEQIALAIQMSMAESTDSTPAPSTEPSTTEPTPTAMETEQSSTMEEIPDYSAVMSDPAFLQHLVGSLPGVDPNSEAIQNAMQALTGGQGGDKSEEGGDKKDDSPDDKEKK